MPFLETLFLGLISNPLLFSIIGLIATGLWGDGSLITLVVIGVNFKISLTLIAVSAYIGTILGDVVWFYLGKRVLNNFESPKIQRNYKRLEQIVDKYFKANHLLLLTFVKFLYGTRVIATVYLSKKKIGLLKFLSYDVVATIPWVLVFGLVGFGVAHGVSWLMKTVKSIQIVVTIFIVFLIIFNILQKRINDALEKRRLLRAKGKK